MTLEITLPINCWAQFESALWPMNTNQILGTVLLITVIIGIAHIAYYHPRLPEKIAIHFNAQGEADGFASRNVNTALMVGLQTGMAAFLFGIGFLIRLLPASLINVPNREYWFAPTRKQESAVKMRTGLLVMAIGTQLFLVGNNHLTVLHNLGHPGMWWFWPLFVVYLVFIVGFCIWLTAAFRLPKDASTEDEGRSL